jgi:hypothetical protein
MRLLRSIIYIILFVGLTAGLAACGGGGDKTTKSHDETTTSHTYSTTSSRGDYSEWTLVGGTLTANLNVVNATGGIDYTWDITATCAAPDSFGVRSCTLTTSGCTDGALVCSGSFPSSFDLMDAPGVALFVHTGSGATAQLHVGFAKDNTACSQDVSGDYTMMHTALGDPETFGLYRSDANFISVLHADFGFDTASAIATPTVAYRTGTPSEVFTDGGCVDGLRTRGLAGGVTVRSMMTSSGFFVLDLPASQGGLISFNIANAASLANFAGKTFGGIAFPDNATPEPIRVVFDPTVTGSLVNFTLTTGSGIENSNLKALATAATVTAPAYPDFTIAPTGYPAAALSTSYPTPDVIPGLYKIDNLSDTGRIVLAAMLFGGKVIAVGMAYNYRDITDTNPSTGVAFTANGLYNTGSFLLFER